MLTKIWGELLSEILDGLVVLIFKVLSNPIVNDVQELEMKIQSQSSKVNAEIFRFCPALNE